ncbi:MAG: hypothetical protein ABI460_06475, partial [Caldimonas sp.]
MLRDLFRRARHSVDVVVGPHDRRCASIAEEPVDDNAFGLLHRAAFAQCVDSNHAEVQSMQGRGVDCRFVTGRCLAFHNKPPTGAGKIVEPRAVAVIDDPGLGKQRADRIVVDSRNSGFEQAAFETRLHVLARLGADDAAARVEQGRVARTRAVQVALADHRTNALDALRELTHVRTAFTAVGIQQGIARSSFVHCHDLPRQVGDVPHALAQALAEKGRLLMRRIAGDEDAADAPAFGHERM